MKVAVIIPDGAADLPISELDGRTPLEAAGTPQLDELARVGAVGVAHTTPPGFAAGSDVCSMCLLGYDPRLYHTGRAPLEAGALGLELSAADWIFRVNLVHVSDDGLMVDHSGGAIADAEARELVAALAGAWQRSQPGVFAGMRLVPGVSYRNILVSSGASFEGLRTTPPHEIPGERWRAHLPSDAGLRALVETSAEVLGAHPVNLARVRRAARPANLAWIWGQGTTPSMPSFEDRFGKRGAITTAVDLLSGIAKYIGWDVLPVPGATSYHDNDYRGQGRAAAEALAHYDVVCCHVEAPDEASHQGDWRTKVEAIEAIDEACVGPIVRALRACGSAWRVLVLPDHYTLVSTRKHDATPVPFVIAGEGIEPGGGEGFSERAAAASGLVIGEGAGLMSRVLGRGAF